MSGMWSTTWKKMNPFNIFTQHLQKKFKEYTVACLAELNRAPLITKLNLAAIKSWKHIFRSNITLVHSIYKREGKRSDAGVWQTPYTKRNPIKSQNGMKTPQKSLIAQRLRADLGWSVGITTVVQLVCLTGLQTQPSHFP